MWVTTKVDKLHQRYILMYLRQRYTAGWVHKMTVTSIINCESDQLVSWSTVVCPATPLPFYRDFCMNFGWLGLKEDSRLRFQSKITPCMLGSGQNKASHSGNYMMKSTIDFISYHCHCCFFFVFFMSLILHSLSYVLFWWYQSIFLCHG